MLIDIPWTTKYVNSEHITKFNTTNGDLIIETNYNGKPFRHRMATRVHTGIYYSCSWLENAIRDYSEYKPIDIWVEQQAEFLQLTSCKDEIEHQRLRDKWLRRPTEYACADNLKQVLHHGRKFVQALDELYVLELHWHDISKDEKYIHKNGGYKGSKRQANEVLKYHYIKVKLK